MYKVVKQNTMEDFDISKIKSSISNAFIAKNKQYNDSIIDLLTLKVTADYTDKVLNEQIKSNIIEESIKTVLIETGYDDIAEAYASRKKEISLNTDTMLDFKKLVNSYVDKADWRVQENSTVKYSLGGLILNNSGAVIANYWLSQLYDKEIADAHRNADLHIHDLSMLSGYCAGWNLKQLIQEGLGGVSGKIASTPASHLSTLCNQMVNFLGILQNEWAG